MASRKNRRTLSRRPVNFTASLTTPSIYSDVRIKDPGAFWAELVNEIRTQSELWRRCQRLWAEFGEVQRALLEGLEAKNWSEVAGAQLVQIAYQAFGVHYGIATFLPPDDDMDPGFRRGLYVQVLMLQALRWVDEAKIPCPETPHPIWIPARAAFYHMATPFVSAEILRRQIRHRAGFHAAAVLVSMDAGAAPPTDDPIVAKAVDELQELVWRKLSGGIRREKAKESPVRRRGSFGITGDIPETLTKEWGSDGLWAYAQALDGALDHAPLAIARDIIDGVRRDMKQSAPDTVEPEETITIRLDHDESERVTLKDSLAEVEKDDRAMAGLAVLLAERDGRQLKDIAREIGVTPQTLINWKHRTEKIIRRGVAR